ncbi:MAG: hypothetical protein WDA18_02255 [Candidatus Ratteibacteria bacterium]|jgi:hypothetical protein
MNIPLKSFKNSLAAILSFLFSPFLASLAFSLPLGIRFTSQKENIPFILLILFVCGTLLPILAAIGMKKLGFISDLHMRDKLERPRFLLLSSVFALIAFMIILKMGESVSLLILLLSYIIALLLVAYRSRFVKVSLHCTMFGGLCMACAFFFPSWFFPVLAFALATAWARIYRGRHTIRHCVEGFCIGVGAFGAGVAAIILFI